MFISGYIRISALTGFLVSFMHLAFSCYMVFIVSDEVLSQPLHRLNV